ncbi:MAG: phenylalanine--tRNA ligase subunit alpha [Mycoplasma sp.]|nr:phenylalanine--tRNA ligase subunit alpha [Mycoplasma sp.]
MDLKNIKTLEELKELKSKEYGPKGELRKLQKEIKTVSPELKAIIGKKITKLKMELEKNFSKKAKEIELIKINKIIEEEWIDVTEPIQQTSSLHPITIITNRARNWLMQNGYFETCGSEQESDEYNFERLNIPKDHPARDMQDSLYINSEKLMRTHNTGFTARTLQENPNKSFAEFSIGKVYRNDEDDSTHSHQFTQIDLTNVGNVSFSELIWTLKSLISYILEEEVKIRLRPSYFPFTEPSVEVDIFYNKKWIEVLGAGMLHQNVLKKAGYTNNKTAFAAGIGVERLAMIKYGIKDIREFYLNDLRFLNQFKEVM